MKKFLVAAVMAIFAVGANAQVWVGGAAGFGFKNAKHNGNERKLTEFVISPEIGYGIDEKWDVAIAFSSEYSKFKGHKSRNFFGFNPYARYTFATTGKVGFFLDGGFNLKVGDGIYTQGDDMTDVQDATEWGLSIQPGVKFAASDKITLVAKLGGLGYQHIQGDDMDCGGKLKSSEFGLNVDNYNIKLGIYYAF